MRIQAYKKKKIKKINIAELNEALEFLRALY